ncbi:MAG: keto-deoxy-phosphogluconate aldolase [Lentisphaerae bacterium GWF2_45_14]|nr:MAG: keto-deoxy-phosphogluconate aldolase [Lentisphaerae bacterium GWF2_45_14]
MQKNIFPDELKNKMEKSAIIAVLVIDNADDAVPLAKTLLDGGIDIMELTLRTPAAIAALKEIKSKVPEMTAGIGTILRPDQVIEAKEAGAVFGVAPGFNPRIVAKAKELGLPFAPGICTPSEIEWALEAGCEILKFFPSETCGGLKNLSAMAAPYAHLNLRYIPLGGLKQENFAEYLKNPAVIAVGGSWLALRDEINKNDWKTIKEKASKARETINSIRG